MKQYGYMIVLLLIAVVFVGCTGGGAEKGNIVGEIRSASTYESVGEAYLEIAGKGYRLNSTGRFQINNIAAGTHQIRISHGDFEELYENVRIEANKTIDRTGREAFLLQPKPFSVGSVVGEVLFADSSAPVRNARVTVAGRTAYTDHKGEFILHSVPTGTHVLEVTHGQLKRDYKQTVTIRANDTFSLYGNKAIVVERETNGSRTGTVAGYIYIRADSQMRATATGETELMFSEQATPPSGYEALSNAYIQIGNQGAYTDWEGMFYAHGLSPGTYTLTVSHVSLRSEIEKINVVVYPDKVTWLSGQAALYGGIGYYIVIGIDDYIYEDEVLKGPVNDAEAVYDTLFRGNRLAGLGRLLINRAADKRGIEDAIREASYLADSSYDYLVIYFSGNSGVDFLSPWDDDGSPHENQIITDVQLEQWVRPFPGNVTLIVDGPDSGTMADGKPFRPFSLRNNVRYTVLAGSRGGQDAYYDPKSGNSVFTNFLLKGIETRGADALPRDGEITARELYEYAKDEMERANRNLPKDEHQNPHIHEGYYGDTVIFRY